MGLLAMPGAMTLLLFSCVVSLVVAADANHSCSMCHGVVSRPSAHGADVVSLLTCRATESDKDADEFCERECRVVVPSKPSNSPKCQVKTSEAKGLSLAQLRETSRLRTHCAPPQPCACVCNCPEIVWPPQPPLPPMYPTPQPHFTFLQESQSSQEVAAQDALPAGWDSTLDPATGKTYYYNEATGVRQWDRPANQPSLVEEAGPFQAPVASPRRLASALQMGTGAGASMRAGRRFLRSGRARRFGRFRRGRRGRGRLSRDGQNPQPYLLLPPPPAPPAPPMPFTLRKDFRPQPCPENAPCNCYCHCRRPPDALMTWKPSHDQPVIS